MGPSTTFGSQGQGPRERAPPPPRLCPARAPRSGSGSQCVPRRGVADVPGASPMGPREGRQVGGRCLMSCPRLGPRQWTRVQGLQGLPVSPDGHPSLRVRVLMASSHQAGLRWPRSPHYQVPGTSQRWLQGGNGCSGAERRAVCFGGRWDHLGQPLFSFPLLRLSSFSLCPAPRQSITLKPVSARDPAGQGAQPGGPGPQGGGIRGNGGKRNPAAAAGWMLRGCKGRFGKPKWQLKT